MLKWEYFAPISRVRLCLEVATVRHRRLPRQSGGQVGVCGLHVAVMTAYHHIAYLKQPRGQCVRAFNLTTATLPHC